MPAYLFLWNPAKDPDSFRDFARVCADAEAGTPFITHWICPSKRPKPGDVAFVQRTGPRNNGVFARGEVIREAHTRRGVQVVNLRLDEFLPLGQELSRPMIVQRAAYDLPWMPMASGNSLPGPIADAVESLWRDIGDSATDARVSQLESESLAEDLFGLEGQAFQRLVTHRRRERLLRDRKVKETLQRTGALACEVPGCGFDFSRVYGPHGAGYAQVHHLAPLSLRDNDQPTRLTDLAVVCANCHVIIHRGGDCREMSSLLVKSRT